MAKLILGLAAALSAPLWWSSMCHAQEDFAGGQTWGTELGVLGYGWSPESDYTETLERFGWERDSLSRYRVAFALDRRINRHFALVLQANSLDRRKYTRSAGLAPDDTFDFGTWAIGIHARAWLPSKNGKFRGYLQFGVGPTVSVTRLDTSLNESGSSREFRDTQWYYHLTGLVGIEGMVAEHVGLYLQAGYVNAPTPENRFGDRHESGGVVTVAGLSFRFGRK